MLNAIANICAQSVIIWMTSGKSKKTKNKYTKYAKQQLQDAKGKIGSKRGY